MIKKIKNYNRNPKNEEGAVAVLVTFLIIVIMGFAALVIDFGGAYLTRVRFQQAVDAASRAASRTLVQSVGLSQSQLQTQCEAQVDYYLQQNGFPSEKISSRQVVLEGTESVSIDATTRYDFGFAKVIYDDYIDIDARGTAKTDCTLIEGDRLTVDVVFVLDISGSMFNNSSRMTTKFIPMINAVNKSINSILSYNYSNRVSVVVYSGVNDSTSGYTKTILNLTSNPRSPMTNSKISGNYQASTAEAPTYIGYKYSSRSGMKLVVSGADGTVYQTSGGTFTQSGICKGAQILMNTGKDSVKRIPSMFILSDGEATYANTDYKSTNITSYNLGDGTTSGWDNRYFQFAGDTSRSYLISGAIGAYTVKTASYWKDQIGKHYTNMYGEDIKCMVYSLGFELDTTTYKDFAEGVLNPEYLFTNNLYTKPAIEMKKYLSGGLYFSDGTDVKYADKFYRATSKADLEAALKEFSRDVVEPMKIYRTRLTK